MAVVVALTLALTRGAVVAARERRRAPRLNLSHVEEDVTRETLEALPGRGTRTVIPVAYVRLGVANGRGRRAAHEVEVLVTRVELLEAGSEMHHRWEFAPLSNLGPLSWTGSEPPSLAIGPGTRRTVDLACVRSEATEANLCLQLKPFYRTDKLPSGTYAISVAVGGSDADAQHYQVTLHVKSGWTPDAPIDAHLAIENGPIRVER